MNVIQSFLDRLISDRLKQDMVSHTRSRIIAGFTILLALIVEINSIRGFMEQDYLTGVIVALVGPLLLLSLVMLKKTSSYLLPGNYVLFMYWGLLTYVVASTSGIANLIISAFVPFIFTAFLLTGLGTGLVWGAVSVATITVLKIMALNGYPFNTPAAEQMYFINAFANFATAIILGAIFAYTSASNLKRSVTLQKQAEKTAGEQKELLEEANLVMDAVSQGDLSRRITVELEGNLGKLKNSINNALSMLSETIAKVGQATTHIMTGTRQLAEAAQTLANGTTQQAASIEEISSSMNEIGSMAKHNNESASQARTMSEENAREAERGNGQMDAMLQAMHEISETSSNVTNVIKAIDEIAFQTNLLALNAAVEAARAGKYGKGFAVVAEEVRRLAARSSEAAKNTTELIETSVSEISNGVVNADQTAAILRSFVESIEKVNDLVAEISAASQEQANAVNEINLSMNQVNEVNQQNASISEETASSAQELTAQARFLQELMNNFVIGTDQAKTDLRESRVNTDFFQQAGEDSDGFALEYQSSFSN